MDWTFSRFPDRLLGEGDSEEVVVPRVAKALGVDLDPSFISFAPLGGRHVNHFWRLLNDLRIPVLTLLDFDLGRYSAGPLRLKYAYDQLGEIEDIERPHWVKGDPSITSYWNKQASILRWRQWFAERGVFYSYPLDLDMMMVRAFPKAYGVDDVEVTEDVNTLEISIFGKGPGLKAYEEKAPKDDSPTAQELAAYEILFKKRGKPGSHMKALSRLSEKEIKKDCPQPLRELIQAADRILQIRSERDSVEG